MGVRNLRPIAIAMLLGLAAQPSCSTFHRDVKQALNGQFTLFEDTTPRLPPEAPPEYKAAVEQLEKENYEDALAALDEFLQQNPATRWTQVAVVNSGRALEGLGRWSEAAERYRSAVRATEQAPKLQAMALYRLSFCYEASGNDQETVATLHDVLGRAKYLPKEVSQAELPARLAAAYSRVGNFNRALDYYKQAESGMSRLKLEAGQKTLPDWLGRTLFYMGNLALQNVSWDNFEVVLRPLGKGQVYLLEAAELGQAPWSDKAATELIATYRDLWNVIEAAPVPSTSDPVIGVREAQERKWDMAGLVLYRLQELRAYQLPEVKNPSAQVKMIFAFVDDLEKQINTLLLERPAGEGLTPESLLRQQMVRGRVVAPDSELERRYLKDKGGIKTLPATRLPEKKSQPASPDREDPNL